MGYNYNTSPVPWYYVYQDIIKGPVTIGQMQKDYNIYRELQPNTMVWTEGMAEWAPLSSTELIHHIMFATNHNNQAGYGGSYQNNTYSNSINTSQAYEGAVPPMQYSMQKANNTYMWLIVAICGLASLLRLSVRGSAGADGTILFINVTAVGLYALFCALDKNELKRTGHRTTPIWWFLIVPVYMFIRAYRLRQFPSYAIVFLITSFVVGFFFGFISAFVKAF
ncbi:DUF4339 domain-containing protein [Paenibacillus lentus]|nr:DUF4339 domain-containing protein [Paenibacillus lentus]